MNSITGTAGNDTLTGTAADDEIFAGDGNDTIASSAGNDVIYGGKGTDTVSYAGAYNNFRLTALYEGKNNSFSGYTVADLVGSEGVDTVYSDVEYLTFSSGSVIYKIDNGTLLLVDTTAPTIAIASSTTSLSASQTATITFTLSESTSNFTASDVTVSGGTLSNFSGSGTTYTALFTPTANSTTPGVVRVASGVFSDAAGNVNADGSDTNNTVTMTVNTVPADTTAPTIAIATSTTSLSVNQTATITFTLSESSSNFVASDVTVSGGTLSNFSGSGTTYTALFTPTANSTTPGVVRVASGVFSDAAGNVNADGSDTNNSVTMTVNTVPADTSAPTIAIESSATSLSAAQTAIITFNLSESSSNFVASDVTVSGGTLSNFSGSGTIYTALFTPTANSTTPGVIRVASGVFSDAAGNVNADGSDTNNTVTMTVNTVPADTTAPTIAIATSTTSLSVNQTATITFTLSESSSNFVASDVTVSGGTLSNFSGSGTTYTALFTPTANSTTPGVVRVASGVFSDAAGNVNADGSDTNNSVTMTVNTVPADTSAPTIAIESSATSLSAAQTAIITFNLSESSSNFVASDVTVSGGTLSNFSGSGTIYTALFTPTANSTTPGVVRVASGVFSDAAGNVNADGSDTNNSVTMTVNTVPADTSAPTIAIESSATSLSAAQTAIITFNLSESSSNFIASDVTVSGGTLSNFSGSGTTYTALFTPTANSTTPGVVRVASDVFSDAAGNVNADGSDTNNTVTMTVNTVPADTTAPTIAVTSDKSSLVAGNSATLTFVVSEPTSNFTIADVLAVGGNLSNFTGSDTTYTALFTLSSNSNINGSVSILSGVFSDPAGNLNTDGADTNNTVYFTRIPTVTSESHKISVIVDKNVIGAAATLLKDLTESITYTNGLITKHIVEYAGLTFDYDQIDSLITTVTRDGDFTAEFTKEINDYLGTELNIAYSAAVKLVGVASIDAVILAVAGADGNYVG